MGYLHIDNLYKNQSILLFKECFVLEKIHGSSAHIKYNTEYQKVSFFSGGESHARFLTLFNADFLESKMKEMFPTSAFITIYGEAYGGKQQGMSNTYGKELKFIAFDVLIDEIWLNVPDAENICSQLNIEFVNYVKIPTDIEILNAERDKPSVQAMKNGCGEDKIKEGIILRPLEEMTTNNGKRIIAKHKRDEFRETKTVRDLSPEKLKVIKDAKAVADEWVSENRLSHVLDKLPQNINIEDTKLVINAMIEDVYREAKGEIIESPNVSKCIGSKTAGLFKKFLQFLK